MHIKRIILLIQLFLTSASAANDTIKVSEDIFLVKLTDYAYVHTSLSEVNGFGRVASNGLIFVDKGEAFLFDTPIEEEQTIKLLSFVQDSFNLKVVGFVANHWHDDCIGGLTYLHKQGIESYANDLTIETIKTKGLPVPKKGFKDSLIIKFHNKEIICKYLGAAHTQDNIVSYIPSENILFGGCMVKEASAKGKGNLADADLMAWPVTVQKVLDNYGSAEYVIPGHGAVGGKELLEHTIEMFRNNN